MRPEIGASEIIFFIGNVEFEFLERTMLDHRYSSNSNLNAISLDGKRRGGEYNLDLYNLEEDYNLEGGQLPLTVSTPHRAGTLNSVAVFGGRAEASRIKHSTCSQVQCEMGFFS